MDSQMGGAGIPAEVRERIIAAANQLLDESGGTRFPTQAEVRRLAQADMNSTSVVMRDWKRQQTAKPEPVAVSVPEPVREAGDIQLAVLWTAAQDLANSSLRAAQDSWAVERRELEGFRQELAQLYDDQKAELEQAQLALAQANQTREASERTCAELSEQLSVQRSRADQAEVRILEMTSRGEELKADLGRAHEETKEVREELKEVREHYTGEIEQIKQVAAEQIELAKSDLATHKGKTQAVIESLTQQNEQFQVKELQYKQALSDANSAEKEAAKDATREAKRAEALQAERDHAQEQASEAKVRAANLEGQLEAVQRQSAALLERIPAPKPPRTPKAKQ